jgi:hypothetical protein
MEAKDCSVTLGATYHTSQHNVTTRKTVVLGNSLIFRTLKLYFLKISGSGCGGNEERYILQYYVV